MILHANEDSPEWIEVPDRGHADFKAIQDKQMFLEQMQNISLCALTGLSKSEYLTMMKELGFVKEKIPNGVLRHSLILLTLKRFCPSTMSPAPNMTKQ